MLWRYVKAQAMVLVCGGLVGPIFLVVYFAFGGDDLLKWMFWVGLLVTAADVLIALALTNYGAKSTAGRRRWSSMACWHWPRSPVSTKPELGSTNNRW